MLRSIIGDGIESVLSKVAPILHQHHITPSVLTLTGLAVNFIGATFYYHGFMVIGGWVILFAGLFDMLDGVVARAGNRATPWGGFMDSVVDRYSDFVIFGGVLAYFAANADVLMTVLTAVVICGVFLISYVRARAELVIAKCDVGLMERPERIILLAAGSIFGFLHAALWILAVTTHITALYRIYYTRREAARGLAPGEEEIKTNRNG
ncbi:MAG: CDP-alcohol phosphatidyltransferase family protein [Deltaproteobacteria bacterium]|nr:CDP-alcohol phosphatidyltransferase family protein [Deltaproteobacteria bacterium]